MCDVKDIIYCVYIYIDFVSIYWLIIDLSIYIDWLLILFIHIDWLLCPHREIATMQLCTEEVYQMQGRNLGQGHRKVTAIIFIVSGLTLITL